MGERVQKLL